MSTIEPGPSLVPPDLLEKVAATTAPEPETAPLLEPAVDAEAGEQIQFVRTGWVRCTIQGTLYRLRPPFLKEFRKLRFALEEMADNLTDLQGTVEVAGIEIVEESAKVEANPDLSTSERVEARNTLRRRSREAARGLNQKREEEALAWFRLAFETLCVDDVSGWLDDFDKYPTWATSGMLPHDLIGHWRRAPLGPGK